MNRLHAVLIVLALLAGVLAAVAGTPQAPLATDQLSAPQLAEWLRDRRPDLILLDLRPGAPSEDRLPGALAAESTAIRHIAAEHTLVVYDSDEVDAGTAEQLRQRWNRPDLLRLHGGATAWSEQVLYPQIRSDAGPRQRADFERRAALSRYFGGQPQVLDPGQVAPKQRSRQGC